MSKKVFISDSTKDSAYAANFIDLLKNFGFEKRISFVVQIILLVLIMEKTSLNA